MKPTSYLSAVLAGFGLLATAAAEDAVKFNVPGVTPSGSTPAKPAAAAPAATPTAPAPSAVAPAKKTFTEQQVVEAYGWYMGAQMGLRQLEFTKDQVDAIARGLAGSASGAQPPFDAREIGPEVEAFLARKNQIFMGKVKAQQVAANAEFFAKLKENKAVVELPSGLRYEVLKPATGATPKPGQVVTFNYAGALITGQVFSSSAEGGQPAEMPLVLATPQNPNGVIAGMFEGLQKTGVGGKVRLYIPPSLAYGEDGIQGGIPPSATLIFEIEIVSIKDAPAAPAK